MNRYPRRITAVAAASCTLILAACASTASHERSAASTEVANDGARQTNAVSTRQPSVARVGGASRHALGVAGTAAPAASPQLSGLPDNTAANDAMVAHFIDVGQGDATLLEFKCGAVLIDTGGEQTAEVSGRERLMTYLEEFFQRRPDLARTLELVVLSHPHADHTDGVDGLLQANPAITIRNVLDNGTTQKGSGIAGQKHLQQYAKSTGAGYVGLAETDITTVGGVTNDVIDPINCRAGGVGVDPAITALWGRVDLDTTWANNANNDSVVVRVDFGNASFLFMGDFEEQGIAAMLDSYSPDLSLLNADVLKVGHHGSHNGTTADLVAAVTPKIAIAQSGDSTLSHALYSAYSYAHPHRDAISLLSDTANGGVSMSRPSKSVRVGVKGRNPSTGAAPRFTTITLNRAIYDSAWDGNIAITAKADGTLSVQAEF